MIITKLMMQAAGANAAWNISSAKYKTSFSLGAAGAAADYRAVFFKPDGTKMFVVNPGSSDADKVNEYDLSTAWDVSTAVFLQDINVAGQDASPGGLFFKPDGTKMYIAGSSNDSVYEYDLSVAWDLSTAVFLQSFQDFALSILSSLSFGLDGTRMYVLDTSSDKINQYSLSTAWDISSATQSGRFNFVDTSISARGLFFKPDGTRLYISDTSSDSIQEYALSTPWVVSSSVFRRSYSVIEQDTGPLGLYFKTDGTKMYIVGDSTDTIYEYSL